MDGILGFSPAADKNGPSFMWTMYEEGHIASAEATFWMNMEGIQSTVTLGGAPPGAAVGEYLEQTLVMTYNTWWTMKLNDAKMNGSSILTSGTKYAISDTGTSLLYLAETDYQFFMTMI